MSQRLFLTVLPGIFSDMFNAYIVVNSFVCFVILCGGTILFSLLILQVSKTRSYMRLLY